MSWYERRFDIGARVEVHYGNVLLARGTVVNFDPEDDAYEVLFDGEVRALWRTQTLRPLSILEQIAEAAL